MDKELKDLLEEQNRAFDEFKKSNDELLKARPRARPFPSLRPKWISRSRIARLSKELDEVAKKLTARRGGERRKVHIEPNTRLVG